MKKLDILEYALASCGIVVGAEMLDTIYLSLGIFILLCQCGLLIYKFVVSVIRKVKKQDYDGIAEDGQKLIDDLSKLKDSKKVDK